MHLTPRERLGILCDGTATLAYHAAQRITAQSYDAPTVEVATVPRAHAAASTRRSETWLALCLAVPMLALSIFLASSAFAKPVKPNTSGVAVVSTVYVTTYTCPTATTKAVQCARTGSTAGYCGKLHYPQQSPHCAPLLPPSAIHPCAAYHWPQQAPASDHCATLQPPVVVGKGNDHANH